MGSIYIRGLRCRVPLKVSLLGSYKGSGCKGLWFRIPLNGSIEGCKVLDPCKGIYIGFRVMGLRV